MVDNIEHNEIEDNEEYQYKGLFFEYSGSISVFNDLDAPESGWILNINLSGENHETKEFEINSFNINQFFESKEDAIEYGKNIVSSFGIECTDVNIEELRKN